MMNIACYLMTAKLVTESPLHIGSGKRTGIIRHTLPYVPGSFLRGAFGLSLIRLGCEKEYSELYVDDGGKSSNIYFRHSYPRHASCKSDGTFLPTPLYMFRCKNPQCNEIYDRLIPPEQCEKDHPGTKSLEPVKGFLCNGQSCRELKDQPVTIGRIVSTAIDRNTGSAKQIMLQQEQAEEQGKVGTLHAMDVIETGTEFIVEILLSRKAGEHLKFAENLLQNSLTDAGIGGSKSRGLGKVKIEKIAVKTITTDLLEQRADEIDSSDFMIRLVSPMVLKRDEPKDDQFLSSRKLLEACRQAYTWCFHEGKPKLPDAEEVHLKAKRFSFETFSGWSLKTNMRRDVLGTVSAGSVFEFERKPRDENFALALAALEFHAVGDFKPHGCGQVVIEKVR